MLTKNIEVMKAEVAAHIAADAVIHGEYWLEDDNAVGGKGCFIGCLAHSRDASVLEERFGLPLPMVKIGERIFEALSCDDSAKGVDFFRLIPLAIGEDGKDLSRAHWSFLKDLLENLPSQPPEIQAVIDPVITGLALLEQGEAWPGATRAAYAADAARAADAAAYAAYAVAGAADAAAYAVAGAADAAAYAAAGAAGAAAYAAAGAAAYAADAAENERQRDAFLQILRDA